MKIVCNGESRDIEQETTVARLLQSLGIEPKQCAVEVNLELVPRTRHAEHRLADGDRLEIVTLVGGG